MLPFSNSSRSGRRSVAVSLAAVIVSVAACSNAATAPTTPTISPTRDASSAQLLTLGATLKVRLADTTGATLKEPGSIKILYGSLADTVTVVDNSSKDKDPTVGFIKVTVSKTNYYNVCLLGSQHYSPDLDGQIGFPYCVVSTSPASTVDLGTLVGQKKPTFKLVAKDEFGALAGGATYSFTYQFNAGLNVTVKDGDPVLDESAGANGITLHSYSAPVGVKVCEIKPPTKMALTSTACFYVPAVWGGSYVLNFTHEHVLY